MGWLAAQVASSLGGQSDEQGPDKVSDLALLAHFATVKSKDLSAPPSERALWAQIAAEVADYLRSPASAQDGLFDLV
jgi:hypothetical protein